MALNGGPSFSFAQASRCSSIARRKKKSMSCGRSSRMLQMSKIEIEGLRRAYEAG
jgi:hypothetical protein